MKEKEKQKLKQEFCELLSKSNYSQMKDYLNIIKENTVGNILELKDLNQLKNLKFLIPDYQRGYRWKNEQIKDLIEDLSNFYEKNRENELCYCLQPIIIKEVICNDEIEIIDGQQRLTTINFILNEIYGDDYYELKYKTIKDENDSVNLIYKENAKEVIKKQLDKTKKENIRKLTEAGRVKFLWYKIQEDTSPNDIFARINNGKIPLTKSELSKALLLTIDKDSEENNGKFIQYKKAYMWDEIENKLEDNEFWYFLINKCDETLFLSTRIDLIFKLYKKIYNIENKKDKIDEFKYIENKLKDNEEYVKQEIWNGIISIYEILREWYEDSNLYHLIGYYIYINKKNGIDKLSELIKIYQNDNYENGKDYFIKDLKQKIIEDLKEENKKYLAKNYLGENENVFYMLNLNYDHDRKTNLSNMLIKKILLLFNICSLTDKVLRFSFYKYKNEEYDIEHIYPSHEKDDIDEENKKKYIELLNEIIEEGIDIKKIDSNEIDINIIKDKLEEVNKCLKIQTLDEKYKDCIGNLALLNSSINRSFKNDYFIQKRKRIIESIIIKKEISISEKGNDSEFIKEKYYILPCTEKVFLKFYSDKIQQNDVWDENDCIQYIEEICKQLNYTFNTDIFRVRKGDKK